MAGLDPSVIGNLQTPKSMSLSDFLGIAKGGYELSKMKELYPAVIAKEQAASQGAQAIASQEQLKNLMAYHSYIVQNIQDEMKNPNISADSIIKRATEINANSPNGGDPKALAQTLMGMPDPKTATKTDYQAFLAGQLGKTLTSQAQFEKMFPAAAQTNLGGVTAPLAQGNPLIAAQTPGTQTGPQTQLGLPAGTELVAQPGDNSGLPPGTKYLTGGGSQPIGGSQVGGGGQGGVTPQQMSSPQGGPAVSALSPQVSTNLTLGNTLVNAARQAAGTAPNIDFAANQAIKLADVTDTGVGSELWNTLKGRGVALPDFNYGNPASNYDKLGHVLAQQNALLAQNPAVSSAMQEGAATNKKLDLASQVSGTTNWTPEGIKYAARTNRALADMSKLYSQGIEQSQVISNNNPLYANQFQSKWNQLVNVDAIRLANAYKYREQDPTGYREIVKELGGKQSKTFKDTASKIDALNDLVARGK